MDARPAAGHQLAARAILEDAPPQMVANAAELIVTELDEEVSSTSDRSVLSASEVHAIIRRLITTELVPIGHAHGRTDSSPSLSCGRFSHTRIGCRRSGLAVRSRDLSSAQPEDLRILASLLTAAAHAHEMLGHKQEQLTLKDRALDASTGCSTWSTRRRSKDAATSRSHGATHSRPWGATRRPPRAIGEASKRCGRPSTPPTPTATTN